MYTQCPECLTAFRVTAGLLQQASGRVRCGSCGQAFNALEHLSEEPPPVDDATEGESVTGPDAPDPLANTFTDLEEFDDIRIEDTGVEWRVVDEEDADDPLDGDAGSDTETGAARWFIAADDDQVAEPAAPLPEVHDEVPADERLVAEGGDTGILVEESGIHDPQEALDLPTADPHEPRYDDNTPLPEDFDASARAAAEEPPARRATDRLEPRSPEFDERQGGLELAAPEDWRELLEEFGASGETRAAPDPSAEKPSGATWETPTDTGPDEDAPADEYAGLPSDIDTQFDLKALEMGIDRSGSRPSLKEAPAHEEVADFGFGGGGDRGATERPVDLELDAEGEAAAIDLEFAPEPETEAATLDFDPGANDAHAVDFEVPPGDGAAPASIDFDPGAEQAADGSDFDFEEAFDDATAATDAEEQETREREAALDAELDGAYAADEEAAPSPANREQAYEVPPQTEEEMTINMQIDQDLMRLAAEEGFSSTLTGEHKLPEDSLLVETIVMEGDFVRNALDKELDEIVETIGGVDDDPRLLLDTYIKKKEQIRGGRRRTDPPSATVIAAVAALGVLLLAQVVHAYRETLATYSGFNHTVGAVYRLLGASLVPEWDVRGWRFEATSGSTDQSDQVLTIRSRITNQSGGDLPYPLLHVALTDRFEEVIGSRVLEPSDYLAEGQDAEATVEAGAEFGATITLGALSSEATGFKLNVCYREDAGQLRCATEDFRN